MEWDNELWVGSVDLKKAFDKIEYQCLSTVVSRQHAPQNYINLPDASLSEVGTGEGNAPLKGCQTRGCFEPAAIQRVACGNLVQMETSSCWHCFAGKAYF